MNNGKTRIYELSKELNLENRDILNICEQLNIAVKSHSSTITESQVERIRAASKRYKSGQMGNKQSSHPATNSGGTPTPKPKGPRKPQIRGIVKHAEETEEVDSLNGTPTLTPPPSRQGSNKVSREEGGSQLVKPPARPNPKVQAPAKPAASSEVEQPPEDVDGPDLLSPPPRPQPPQKSKLEVRPVLKRNRKGEGEEKEAIAAPVAKGESPKTVDLDAKPPKLQKPQKPKPPKAIKPDGKGKDGAGKDLNEEDPDSETVEEVIEEETLLAPPERPQPKLKRPPSRSKRRDWEEEEEETEETVKATKSGKASKTSKTSAKPKRRSQTLLLDEDDDDLDALNSDGENGLSVSLSMARPPKPNQDKPATPTVAASKGRRAKPKTDGGEQRGRSQRENRANRDRKNTERPESVVLQGNFNIRELSELVNVPETDIIKQLFSKGIAVNITQTLDLDTAKLVVEELGIAIETPTERAAATKTEMLDLEDLEKLQRRPPVVTIMGHVDHGKTTLLDSIRKTKVAQGEAGGITQHIGAYHVDVEHEGQSHQVVFLDTPGHEAFTAMRARGTKVTDVAVLVVAADDGVQPQTKEAISHARAAEVPIVVAINKMDKIQSEPDRVKQELAEQGLLAEEWGGDTVMVPVSAIKGENLDTLLEMIILVSEMSELSANPDRPAKGTVIEANLDKSRGPVATLLVQNGTLRVGDCIVAGSSFGKIRAMIDDRGDRVDVATPSFAVEVLGLNDVPSAGDEFDVFPSEKEARAIAQDRAQVQRESRLQQAVSSRRVTLSSLSAQAKEGELKELNLIIKADVQGSVEAILGSLAQLPQNEVQIRVLLAAPGEITETDVDLAAASGAVVVGFNTDLAPGAQHAADQEGVDVREYNIIYKLLDDIQGAMEGLLEPEEVEEYLGTVEVRAVFTIGKGAVAGCYVQSGKVMRNRRIRVRRKGEVIYDGPLDSLKRMKDDVREVNTGFECGIGVNKFHDWQEGDSIEAYQMVTKRRTLSPA
ncbi:translation initiation factor IF-2 [Spirulina subsalsa FACHB-351]|uniref:Translation initiation factor IF-2 n=1 Tax=Spirulina subsalsa FACHB-351 TaxID=234711 RepID=A0ABT3L132_9CYAN|nr:translation initiation factor IF-2 [Spirulina subsalsa]MCW6034809.1 translation initiation factor IF-2 [Spirulina subsalsa FACHB-351]